MSLPFLKAESEENATQAIAFIGIVVMTVGLTVMNVSGALAGSESSTILGLVIRVALAVIISGAEILAAVALVRAMLAPNKLRRFVALAICVGLAWACIQNGKKAVHLVYPEFKESAALLKARAGIADTEAKKLEEARSAAISAAPAELANIRSRIATLEGHQELMQARSPEKIMEAQTLLTVTGHYFGQIDGKRERLTESAMRAYGEEISKELAQLRRQEANLSSGAVLLAPPVASDEAAMTPAEQKADFEDRARRAREAALWIEVMLWVFEAARGLGLWALVTTITDKKAPDVQYSDDVPDGMTRWEGTAEEWEEIEKALQVHRNIKTGNKKGARTKRLGNKIEAESEYYRARISMFMDEHNRGASTDEIAKKHGMTVAVMRMSYGPYMTPEESAALFPVAPPEPQETDNAEKEPQLPEDQPDAEAAQPEEADGHKPSEDEAGPPKTYPVDFPRKPNANGADHDIPNQ